MTARTGQGLCREGQPIEVNIVAHISRGLRMAAIARIAAFAALVVFCVTASCATASTDPPATGTDPARARLIGSWTFVRGCGGLTGRCTTDSNEPSRYLFRADDTVEAFVGGTRAYAKRYGLVAGAANSSKGDTRPVLLIGPGPAVDPRPLLVSFRGDTLVLDEGCCDRFAFEYRRP